LADATIEQMRQIARNLRPVSLDTEGLFAPLENLCQNFAQRTRLEVQYNIGGEEPPLMGEMRISLYRFVQEALTNVAKHANARRVRVSADGEPGEVRISVTDDGQGFDVPSRLMAVGDSPGIGLLDMRERLELLGGELEIISQPGQGTRLVARVPILEGI
jgi:signal transduction histidine kinase